MEFQVQTGKISAAVPEQALRLRTTERKDFSPAPPHPAANGRRRHDRPHSAGSRFSESCSVHSCCMIRPSENGASLPRSAARRSPKTACNHAICAGRRRRLQRPRQYARLRKSNTGRRRNSTSHHQSGNPNSVPHRIRNNPSGLHRITSRYRP